MGAAPDHSNRGLEFLPESGEPQHLFVVLHGVGANAQNMAPVGRRLRSEYPESAVLIPNGFESSGGDPERWQWFSVQGVTEGNRAERVARALPKVVAYVRAAQIRFGVAKANTVIAGFSQGGIIGVELASAHHDLVGRVLVFSGRYATLPRNLPERTAVHFFHGSADPVIAIGHARQAVDHLAGLGGEVTLDVGEGVGHQIDPTLLDCAVVRLRMFL